MRCAHPRTGVRMIKTRTLLVPIYGSSEIFVTRRAPKEPKGYQETIPDITCSPLCHLAKVTEVNSFSTTRHQSSFFPQAGRNLHISTYAIVCFCVYYLANWTTNCISLHNPVVQWSINSILFLF